MRVRKRLLSGSLAVAAVLLVVVAIAIGQTASDDPVDDEIVLDANNPLDQPQTLTTNAVVTGRPLPRVDVQTQEGEDLSTASLIGRPLVVNIWYSGCLPCKKELPDFAQVHGELGEQVRFIGLDSLAPSDVERAFAEAHGVRYELLYDSNGSFLAEAGVTSQPVTLFVAADGTIVEQTGQIDAAELRAIITDQLLVIALDARFATSFTTGLIAAVNPCGFVLLPTYLMYFLGMENLRPGTERTSILRALQVSLAVSSGFMLVFLVIGGITKWSTNWFVEQAPWVALAIGVVLVVLGVAMVFGVRLPFTTPKLEIGRRDRSVRSMFVFGIAYAVASIGCIITPFVATVLGAVSTGGIGDGIIAVGLYGLGMALIVTGLTVTLAMANTAVLRVLRRGMAAVEYVAGIFVMLTGLYLVWYWYSSLNDGDGGTVVSQATSWQESLAAFIQRHQIAVVTLAGAAIALAVVLAYVLRRRPAPPLTEAG